MKNALWLCVIAFLGLYTTSLHSQYATQLQYLTVDEGLSQNDVTCILQDKTGFLWIGTRGGLNRYDGYGFYIFQNEIGNPNSLANNSIESIFEDSKGRIWIGTRSNGLSCYDPITEKFTHFQHNPNDSNSISGNRVIAIAEGKPGEIWLGTRENGLNIFLEKENRFIRRLNGPDNIKVQSIHRTRDGEMWIGSSGGLRQFDLNGQMLAGPYIWNQEYFNDYIKVIEDHATGELWVGTWRKGLLRFDRKEKKFTHQYLPDPADPNSISFYHIYSLLQDPKGDIWIGTWGGGLNIFDREKEVFSHMDLTPPKLGLLNRDYQYVMDIFQDKSGIIWFATQGAGLVKLDESKNQFNLIASGENYPGQLNNGHIASIIEDSEGGLLVGTKGGGLNYARDGKNFTTIPLVEEAMADQIPAPNRLNWVTSLLEDHRGVIWASTEFGLHKLRKNAGNLQLETIYNGISSLPNRLAGSQVKTIYETSDSVLWIGMVEHGLNLLSAKDPDKEKFLVRYISSEKPGDLKNNWITAILEDSQKRIWVGTEGGLHLYQKETEDFRHFGKVHGNLKTLSSNMINCLLEDRRGRLWIGTSNGLNLAHFQVNGEWTFSCFQEKHGLPNTYINAILEDTEGNLWISTDGGISKFNPEEKVFYNYDVTDGLQANDFSERAAFQSADSTFYFGGIYGVNYFKPEAIHNNPRKPSVIITDLKIYNKEVEVGGLVNKRIILNQSISFTKSIELTYRERVFSIDFVALDYHAPNKNLYVYKLEGLEEEWNDAGSKRNVTYTNLDPGSYTFHVKAANNSQLWNEEGASLEIRVLPPPWATPQAYVFYVLVFAGLLLAYRQNVVRQNELENKLEMTRMEQAKDREMADMKSRFFTNITHELRTPLTLISGPINELIHQKEGLPINHERSRGHLLMIHHHSKRLLGLVNRLLDFRKAETGHMQLEVAEGNLVPVHQRSIHLFSGTGPQEKDRFSVPACKREHPHIL